MAGELAPRQNQAVSTTVSLSSPLALAVKGTPVYGENGFDADATTWSMPSRITEAMIAEAKRKLPEAEAACSPTTREGILRWIGNLGIRCRSTPDPEQAKTQAVSYAQGFEHAKIPGISFTHGTLEKAASRFTFFPAYAELRDFLLEQASPQLRLARRLKMIAEAKPTTPETKAGKTWQQMTQAERDAFDGKLSALTSKLLSGILR